MNRIIACLGLSGVLFTIGLSLNFAEPHIEEGHSDCSFAVTIQVFADGVESPQAEHLVLFDRGIIYSLPSSDTEPATVFNEAAGTVILLDRKSRIRTTISTAELISMTGRLQSSASSDELKDRLGINAKVACDTQDTYAVTYGDIQYSTTTHKPADSEWAVQFGKFADCVSHLNIAQKRGLPPFGRMRMNAKIAFDKRIPLETQVSFQQDNQTHHYRSTHKVVAEITRTGRSQIDQVNSAIALSKDVPLTKFGT